MALGTTADTTMLMWQYFGMFLLYSLVLVGALIALVSWLRKKPDLLKRLQRGQWFGGSSASEPKQQLNVEERLALEPNKTLYVVRYGEQRYLLATSGERTDCLAKLQGAEDVTSGLASLEPERGEQSKPFTRGREEESDGGGLLSQLSNWAPSEELELPGQRKASPKKAVGFPPFGANKR